MTHNDPRQTPRAAGGTAPNSSTRRRQTRGSKRVTPSPAKARRIARQDAARKGCSCDPNIVVVAFLGGESWHMRTEHDDHCAVLAEFGDHTSFALFPGGGDAA